MERASRQSKRTAQIISQLELSSPVKNKPDISDDLFSLLANLCQILLEKSVNNDDMDSTISEHIKSIITKINELNPLSEPKNVFDKIQKAIEIYIKDLLSITQCSKILCNESFQEIFCCLIHVTKSIKLSNTFENDTEYARTVFNRSLEMLSLPVIQEFLRDKYLKELFNHLASIVYPIIEWISETIEYIRFKKNDIENHITNFSLLIEYIDRNKQNVDQKDVSGIVEDSLTIFWNLADKTILVPNLLKANCVLYFVKWISLADLSMDIQTSCIHILHNLARHDQGAQALNDVNCISVLKDFKRRILDPNKTNEQEPYVELRLLYCMILSLLTEPKENRHELKDLKKVLNQLMELVVDAGQSDTKASDGFHVSEPLVVLTKLCLHDEILHYIMKDCSIKIMQAKSTVDFFCELLMKFRGALTVENNLDQLTLVALFNMIWSISFHDDYIVGLKSNSKFLITVKSLANDDGASWVQQYVPKYLQSVPKAANGILWNLDENNPARTIRNVPPSSPITAEDQKKSDKTNNRMRVMVSYSHADNKFCHQLVDHLQKDNRFEIWVDFAYCHTEDLWEEIGEAIEKADVVLFLMSKDYQDSKSCRQEVMYTKDSLKKRFIPIYVRKDFVATGWLGVRIVGPQYIRFGKKSFDETAKDLIKIIADDSKQQVSKQKDHNLTSPAAAAPAPPIIESKPMEENNDNLTKSLEDNHPIEFNIKRPNKPVETWTKKEINQWFDQHHIQQELIDIYDFQRGTDLILYGQCLRPDWQIEYADMRTRYEQKYNTLLYRDQFVRLVSAINSLQSSQVHSKTCIIT